MYVCYVGCQEVWFVDSVAGDFATANVLYVHVLCIVDVYLVVDVHLVVVSYPLRLYASEKCPGFPHQLLVDLQQPCHDSTVGRC